MLDLLIKNARYPDFLEGELLLRDVGIKDGKIILDTSRLKEGAKRVVDGTGLILSPGFIDIHMHEERLEKSRGDFDISYHMLHMGVTTAVGGNCGSNRQSIKDFFKACEGGAPINYLLLTGHNYYRDQLGIDRYEKASPEAIKEMNRLLKEDLALGACGISFGLAYAKGITLEEILGVTKGLKDTLLTFHARADAKGSRDSVLELIEIAKKTGLPLQFSHMGSNAAMGQMEEALSLLTEARAEGLDIEADCYPYAAFSTDIGTSVFDDGCFESWEKDYDSILLIEEPYKNVYCDEALFKKVRREHPEMAVVAFVMNEEEVEMAYKEDFVFVASDGGIEHNQGHPRASGTFPRVLGLYVREKRVLTLVESLKKMTLMPAKRLGIEYKGEIKEGYDADLVLFNPETIKDKATFLEPYLKPEGIEMVIIGGNIALEGVVKNNRLGKVIKGGKHV